MRARFTAPLAIALMALVAVSAAGADPSGSGRPAPELQASGSRELRLTLTDSYVGREGSGLVPEADAPRGASRPSFSGSRDQGADTLWIFDADFSDLTGDNAGWTSIDRSGTLGQLNYWHKDTIRINGFAWLGDSTWWCGTYDPCWRQPRGYGNNWRQHLSRDFPLSTWSAPGDAIVLEFDQRYAMERLYDYGYVDVSTDAGLSWNTVISYNNGGFMGPGWPRDWDHPELGHQALDLSGHAGSDVRLRFRFDSDIAYSAQDSYDNPPQHSVKDGAWQLDNIEWKVNGAQVWLDDCESLGENGWQHPDIPPTGQTGVTFWRGQYGIDFWTGRGFSCDAPPVGTWMYAAVDSATSKMVDGEDSWLLSPLIDVSEASKLVGQWHMWVDLPRPTNDIFNLAFGIADSNGCIHYTGGEDPGWWYGGPFWGGWSDDWSAFTGNDFLVILWQIRNDEPAEEPHMGGIFLNRQRVGIPIGDLGTRWSRDAWNKFNDWFDHDLAEAFEDTARVRIKDDDDVAWANLLASNDGGATWDAYECRIEGEGSSWWHTPPPVTQMTPGSEIRYYWEAMDGLGNTSTFPSDAPGATFEMSILPIEGSVEEPSILLVDKIGGLVPGEDRSYRHSSEYYLREALEILGFEFDTYDVEVPQGSIKSDGPDTSGMKYYDTQIWFAGDARGYVVTRHDQRELIGWLSQASEGKERNLFLTGNNIGWYLIEAEKETLDFYTTWLASDYVQDTVGSVIVDSIPTLRDASGGFDFMTTGDGQCLLAGGCPELPEFDVVQPQAETTGAETVAVYVREDMSTLTAGVAYTHATMGYQTVNLGFGIEFMMSDDAVVPGGVFQTGIADRADLVGNIMEYFGKEPTGTPTTAPDTPAYVTRLGRAFPNPFNPVTTIEYSVATDAHVALRVYSVAGRLARTLIDGPVTAGHHTAVWDGKTEQGHRAASGVYFVRMDASDIGGSVQEEKTIVLLK